MIVRETKDSFILIKQHDHAQISGQLAENWNEDLSDTKKDLLFAIYQHDRGWIDLDDTPFWNDQNKSPYSFLDFPFTTKVVHYKHGIDQIEAESPYAALICSLHYHSIVSFNPEEGSWFLQHENNRQQKLKASLKIDSHHKIRKMEYGYQLLKFCDRMSIYLCVNEPGISKEDEYELYKNGFKDSELFRITNGKRIIANWMNTNHVSLTPFPFRHHFDIRILYKEVFKDDIMKKGIVKAYIDAECKENTVNITDRKD
ncbi:DUF3891 family protein [Caldalkalibacillus mannanilyticus]|uniref:DUF3891 family protein n=1 Tax=Caldalkalibacillus mannanilyticus TaxID=1418 RepID=UPI000468B6D7|nr:DUF3891 family protein [Caldalkalibacillus mannanilyticus]